jgi:hypothetical protein
MKTNNLKDAFKRLILSNADDPGELIDEIKGHLSAMEPPKKISLHRGKVKSVKKIRKAEDEYVYDIGMKNESKPWYFGNNILIHNSIYFSAYPALRDDIESGKMEWNKEICIQLYDTISDELNDSFPGFMKRAFHCPEEYGSLIRGGRELVASKGLFITKKRYALLVYDQEGERKDVAGKPGKIKAMGLDLKRSDTPKAIQDFLNKILTDVLTGASKDDIIDQVMEFKRQFEGKRAWEKGTPKRVNNLTKFVAAEQREGRTNMPGHVRAAMNWNTLRAMHGDNHSLEIVDGMKTIVCKLKANPMEFTSVGYPTDQAHLPEWFTSLPFDDSLMESAIIDQKLDNLLGVLNWDIVTMTDTKSTFQSLFNFD